MPENIKYTGAPTQTPEEARRTAAIPEYRLDFPQVRLSRAGEEAGQEVGRATQQLGATMGLVGRSIDSLGKTMEGAGTELWNRAMGIKQLESETKVNNATVAWELGQVKRDEEFKTKAGDAANSQALEAQLKTNEEGRQKVRNTLTPYEQKLFDAQTTRQLIISARNSGAHSAQETKTLAGHAIEARVGLLANGVASAQEDPDAKAKLEEMARIYDTEWRHINGANDDMVHRAYMIAATKAIASRAERVASEGDPTHALKILEDNKKDLDDVDTNIYRVAYDRVSKLRDQRDVEAIVNNATGDRDETYEPKEKRALEEAEKTHPGDDLFKKKLINELKSRHAIDHAKMMADRQESWDTVDAALHGRVPGQTDRPKTDKELMAVPGVKEVYGKLSSTQLDEVERNLAVNARGHFPDNDETRGVYHFWDRMFDEDKDEMRRKDQEDNNWIEKLPIPAPYRNDLWTRNRQLRKEGIKAEDETPASKIFNWGKQTGNIPDKIASDKTKAEKIKMYISSEVKAWQKENPQKFPKKEDWNTFIHTALGKGEAGIFWGHYEEYRRDITKWDKYKMVKDDYVSNHPNASDSEINKHALDVYVLDKVRRESKGTTQGPKVETLRVRPGG